MVKKSLRIEVLQLVLYIWIKKRKHKEGYMKAIGDRLTGRESKVGKYLGLVKHKMKRDFFYIAGCRVINSYST